MNDERAAKAKAPQATTAPTVRILIGLPFVGEERRDTIYQQDAISHRVEETRLLEHDVSGKA